MNKIELDGADCLVKCSTCGSSNIGVIDTRASSNGRIIRRRRKCESCGRRQSTYESSIDPRYALISKLSTAKLFDTLKRHFLDAITTAVSDVQTRH